MVPCRDAIGSWPIAPRKLVGPSFSLPATSVSAVRCSTAPTSDWIDSTGRQRGLSAPKGQPVALPIAPAPHNRAFRAQLGQLRKMYERYAAHKVVFLAVFTQEAGLHPDRIFPSPWPRTDRASGHHYEGGERFTIAFIGRDGNLARRDEQKSSRRTGLPTSSGSPSVPQRDLRRP